MAAAWGLACCAAATPPGADLWDSTARLHLKHAHVAATRAMTTSQSPRRTRSSQHPFTHRVGSALGSGLIHDQDSSGQALNSRVGAATPIR